MLGRQIFAALLLALAVHNAEGLAASLCFNRVRELACGMDIPAEKGYNFEIGSVTIVLASKKDELEANSDGVSCTAVQSDCTANLRPSTFESDRFSDSMREIYNLVVNKCVGKSSCEIEMPNYNAIELDSLENTNCVVDGSVKYYFRSVYLDLPCYAPAIQVEKPTTTSSNDTDSTDSGEEKIDIVTIDKDEEDKKQESEEENTKDEKGDVATPPIIPVGPVTQDSSAVSMRWSYLHNLILLVAVVAVTYAFY